MNPPSETAIEVQRQIEAHAYQDRLLDQALADTFPASDPISPGQFA